MGRIFEELLPTPDRLIGRNKSTVHTLGAQDNRSLDFSHVQHTTCQRAQITK